MTDPNTGAEDAALKPLPQAPVEDAALKPLSKAPAEDATPKPLSRAPAEDATPKPLPKAPALNDEKERRKVELDTDLKKTARWLFIAFLSGWLGLLLRWGFSHGASATGEQTATTFIWTLAWLAAGFVFGFIFGIPKVITATTSTTNPALNDPPEKPAPKLKVNTNLEDISDWLTKVLVGATLTQIGKIPQAVHDAAWFMAAGETGSLPGFNAAIIIYYSALGFLSGYILTRMFFARAFESVD